MRFLEICLLGFLATGIAEANPLESNLAYRSPFGDHPQVSTSFFRQALTGAHGLILFPFCAVCSGHEGYSYPPCSEFQEKPCKAPSGGCNAVQ